MPATTAKTTQKLQRWKHKNAQKQRYIKRLTNRVKQLTRSRNHWRTRYYQLKQKQQPLRLKHHPYCLKLMQLSIVLHIHHNLSLRACSAVLYEVGQLYGQAIKRISAATVRAWSMRIGHYYLQMRLAAGSYVLIADESILVGNQKLLVLLAVRQEDLCRIAPLTMSDVVVLHVEAATSWKGEAIAQIIQNVKPPQVDFVYAVSDKANNLRNAFARCQLPWIENVTHYVAHQARLLFEQNSAFHDFMRQQQLTRAKWVLSQYAPYLPPNARQKARFHQLLGSAEWGRRVLAQWAKLPPAVQTELSYVCQHRPLIELLLQVEQVVDSFSRLLKSQGIQGATQTYWQKTRQGLEAHWQEQGLSVGEELLAFLGGLDGYLTKYLPALPQGFQLLCCSDVVESMFGKYKYGFSGQVFSGEVVKMAAYGRSITASDVSSAMGCISHRFLRKEAAKQPPSFTQLRRKALPKIPS